MLFPEYLLEDCSTVWGQQHKMNATAPNEEFDLRE